MKKTLAAVAVLGAFAGSAIAADLTLYGIVDTGVGYNHTDFDGLSEDTDSFAMKGGQQSGSRWGLKGAEELGNGLTVGFILESGFDSDTGSTSNEDRLFNREASLYLQGGFGRLGFGRIGAFNNGQSSWGKIGMINAFGTSSWGGYTTQVGNVMSTAGQWDNTIAYETPNFAGFQVFAQYSMGNTMDSVADGKDGHENESDADRYYAIGATYKNGPVAVYFAVDSVNYKSFGPTLSGDVDDSLTVTLGGSYDFEVAKVYLGAQYFDEVKLSSIGGVVQEVKTDMLTAAGLSSVAKVKGYGISLTADAPVAGGKLMAGLSFTDAEAADSEANQDFEIQRYGVSVGYDYPFSKRTDVYAVAGWMQDSVDWTKTESNDLSAYSVYVGLRHKF